MGKTQLVLNYVNQLKEDYYDYRVRWIEAGSQESLEKSFREFAEDLSIEILNCNFNKVRELVLKKLEKGVDKSLLVFDNALSKDLIKDYIPEFSKKKKHDIIITTQNVKDWEDSYSVKKCNIIKLEALSPEDASDLVKSVLGDVEKGDANKLANLFSCIPLGLTQSLAFIKFNKCGIKDYFDELKGTKKTLENSKTNTENSQTDSQLYSQNSQTDSQISALSYQSNSQFIPQLTEMVHFSLEDASHEHIPNIYTTLKITLDIIKQEFPSAYKIVKLCSYLNADSIPFELFNHFFQKIRDKNYATSVLEGYSLLSVSEKNNDQFLDIHRIVQQIIIHETPLAQRSDDIIELAEHIVEQKLFTRDNIVKEKYQNNTKFLLHIESLIRKAKKYSIELNSELVFLELATAVYHDFNGDHQKAIKKLSILKKSIEELVGDSSDLTIIIQNLAEKSSKLPTLYAQIYYHLGKANLSIYLKKITDLNNLNNNFNKLNQDSLGDLTKAIKIREIIDNNSEFDESYNSGSAERPMDTIIFERQGILFWHKSQNTINGLLEALKGYEKLINFEKNLPENLRDKFNLDTCRRLYIECSVEMPNFKSDFTNLLKMVGENLSINYGDLNSISEREKFAEQIYQTLESKVNEYFRIAREFNLIGKIFIKIYDFSKSIKDLDLARKFIQKAKALEESNGLQNFIFEDANKLLEQLSLSESSANHNKKITDLDHSVSISLESFANNFLELKKILDSCKQDDENNNSGEKNSKLDDLVNQLKEKSARFLENLDNQQNEVADEIVINSAINLDENSASDVPANNDAALDLINQQNLLLERINKIKEIVGEQSINKYSGFYNYIYNALSHNLFSNSAKQIIDIINKLVESLENVINWSISTSQENTEVADYGSHLWVQLEYLLEFTASGQKFIGFSGRRAPGIGPNEGDGGGYYGSGYYQESDRNGAHQDQGDSLSVDYCNNGTSIDSSIGTLSNTTIAETRGLKSFGSESLLNFEAEI